jgi:hypothetical protein
MNLESRLAKLEKRLAHEPALAALAPGGPTLFQQQMASMLASILPPSIVDGHLLDGPTPFRSRMEAMLASIRAPSVVDGHLLAGGAGQAEDGSNNRPIYEHPGA